ncbi:MAG: 30S ribosomal protein S12 methylthiotransferase RimO [Planctomycetaceae bacterium]|nr:30S ribosomal protein S12 methylthiotransferase RimO [Planctomycetaceae bacterium]
MSSKKKSTHRSYALVSLGCPKNLVDSERMAGLLDHDGYRMVGDPRNAETVIVNTCGFIGDARDESYRAIEEMLRLKDRGRVRRVVVAGCLAEREREALLERYPGIDQLIGVFARDEIAVAINGLPVAGKRDDAVGGSQEAGRALFSPAPSRPLPDSGRHRITLRHLAYLKIAEGCNRLCSFCAIPQMRGRYASKPIDQVVAEAEELAADGVRELVLVAQDTTFYGLDLDGRPQLAELLRRLDRVDGLSWIRLMYLYPMHITDELIETIAGASKVLPYLDIPLQHISDDVLRRMRRQVNRRQTEELLDRLRGGIKSLSLRTTLLAGFPGETEEQFEELLEFVRRQRFERLGAFAFSNEPGTAAADLDQHLPEEVKLSRRDRLMAAQQEVAFAWNASQVGKRLDVMIDRPVPGQRTAYVGRCWADAPEVDGQVYVTGENLAAGQIVACEIVAAKEYDLIAVA